MPQTRAMTSAAAARRLESLGADVIDLIFDKLTLVDLSRARGTSKALHALLDRTWRTTTERLLTSGEVLPNDVAKGWHTSLFRWMLKAPIARIQLAAGTYDLGNYTNPEHSENADEVPGPDELEAMHYEGRPFDPKWKAGYGPLTLSKSVAIVGAAAPPAVTIKLVADDGHMLSVEPTQYVFEAPDRTPRCEPVDVVFERLQIISEGWGLTSLFVADIWDGENRLKKRLRLPFLAGPTLRMTECRLQASSGPGLWCSGRALVEDCDFLWEDGNSMEGDSIFIGDGDPIVYWVENGVLEEVLINDPDTASYGHHPDPEFLEGVEISGDEAMTHLHSIVRVVITEEEAESEDDSD